MLIYDDDAGYRDYTRNGFIAIGSGHTSAIASLAFHKFDTACSLNQAIYQVCAAKFMAERADGVGPETIVICLRDDGKTFWLFGAAIRHIRKMWDQKTRPTIPSEADTASLIDPMISELGWSDV